MRRESSTNRVKAAPGKNPRTIHPSGELRLIFQSDPLAVRQTLHSILSGLGPLSLSRDECGTVELVLAEVMNNIVEHAYAGDRRGVIEIRICQRNSGLVCTLLDDGLPMPEGNPPLGEQQDLNCPTQDLPEGGFGWFLIRELAHDLSYERVGNKNLLSFRLPIGRPLRKV